MKKKIGIVGLGSFAEKYIETIQKSNLSIEISTACRKTNTRPDFLPSSCSFTTNPDKVVCQIKNKKLDGVILVADPETHYDLLTKLIPLKAPIIVEKPPCFTSRQAEHLNSLQDEFETSILVHYSPLYNDLNNWSSFGAMVPSKLESENVGFGPFRSFSPLYDYVSHELAFSLNIMNGNITPEIEFVQDRRNSENQGVIYDIVLNYDGVKHMIRAGNGSDKRVVNYKIECKNHDNYIAVYDKKDLGNSLTNILQKFNSLMFCHSWGKLKDLRLAVKVTHLIEKINSRLESVDIITV